MGPPTRILDFNEHIAQQKYREFRNIDPFPGIPCALLNSADIIDYVEKTAMINPFYIGEDFLKPASYSLQLSGAYIYWDSKEKMVQGNLENKGDFFTLRRNTVAFVSLDSKLRLPHYIAARFNLQIKHVHRGIILGTGPLVDPGFTGDLLIPLHNLTNNDYNLYYNEQLIWMEFTKISNSSEFVQNMGNVIKGKFFPFKESSSGLPPTEYLKKASPHSAIVNSISFLIEEEKKVLEQTQETQQTAETVLGKVQDTLSKFNIGVIATIVGFLLSIFALLGFFLNLTNSTKNDYKEFKKEIQEKKYDQEINQLKQQISTDSISIRQMKTQLDTLK